MKSMIEEQFFRDIARIDPTLPTRRTLLVENGSKLHPDVIIEKHKIIFEFYGDYWHANPQIYKSTDKINDKTAEEIWDHDLKRQRLLERRGYKVYILWESDYKKQRNLVMKYIKYLLTN